LVLGGYQEQSLLFQYVVRVDHEVKMAEFERWLERPGGSPREAIDRQRIRAILGMAA
jgi:hypothetical protein